MTRNKKPRFKKKGGRPGRRDTGVRIHGEFKLLSNGQTGVGRGAMNSALEAEISCGGWCSQGRMSEDGFIPDRYPVQELEDGDHRDSTRRNVLQSDGAVIVYFEEIDEGDPEDALDDCVQLAKPYRLIDASSVQAPQAAKLVGEFIKENGVSNLFLVGPSAGSHPKSEKYGSDLSRFLFESVGKRNKPHGSPQHGGHAANGNGSVSQNGTPIDSSLDSSGAFDESAGNGASEIEKNGRGPQPSGQRRRRGSGRRFRRRPNSTGSDAGSSDTNSQPVTEPS